MVAKGSKEAFVFLTTHLLKRDSERNRTFWQLGQRHVLVVSSDLLYCSPQALVVPAAQTLYVRCPCATAAFVHSHTMSVYKSSQERLSSSWWHRACDAMLSHPANATLRVSLNDGAQYAGHCAHGEVRRAAYFISQYVASGMMNAARTPNLWINLEAAAHQKATVGRNERSPITSQLTSEAFKSSCQAIFITMESLYRLQLPAGLYCTPPLGHPTRWLQDPKPTIG